MEPGRITNQDSRATPQEPVMTLVCSSDLNTHSAKVIRVILAAIAINVLIAVPANSADLSITSHEQNTMVSSREFAVFGFINNSRFDQVRAYVTEEGSDETRNLETKVKTETGFFVIHLNREDTNSTEFDEILLITAIPVSSVTGAMGQPAEISIRRRSTYIKPISPQTNSSEQNQPVLTRAPDVTFTSHDDGSTIKAEGATVFGKVENPLYDQVEASIRNDATNLTRTVIVDVGARSGVFALRIFREDIGDSNSNEELQLSATPRSTATGAAGTAAQINVRPRRTVEGYTQIINRLTFGYTQTLQDELETKGYDTWLTEQLDPDQFVPDLGISAVLADYPIEPALACERVEKSIFRQQIAYAAHTQRQLREVVGKFWANHFHTTSKSVVCEKQDEIEFYRESAFGYFEDLLGFMAKSPQMLNYLDNKLNRRGAINENFARELLELHTVGVNAGYTDDDVIAIARIFTGWTIILKNPDYHINNDHREWEFAFDPDWHDTGDKYIEFLDLRIKGREGADGVLEGEELITVLANHPKTIRMLCQKLVVKFFDDTFTDTELCEETWRDSGGQMRTVIRALLQSPDFFSEHRELSKVKTPFEFAVGLVRNFDLSPSPTLGEFALKEFMQELVWIAQYGGWDNLRFPAPTGLPEESTPWLSIGSMIGKHSRTSYLADKVVLTGLYRMRDQLVEQNLETAEATASFLVRLGLGDRARPDEYNAIVRALQGEDGRFTPYGPTNSVRSAISRAFAVLVVTPTYQLQ